MKNKRYFLFVSAFFLIQGILLSDYLKISRTANLKQTPNSNSFIIIKLNPDDTLQLLDDGEQENGYYHAETIPGGRQGYIYRTFVRRYPGEIPHPELHDGDLNPLLDSSSYLTSDQKRYALRHLKIGKPQALYERVRDGYIVAYDARLKIPAWIQYELNHNELNGPAERKDDFKPDYSIPNGARSELIDYRNSGYARGHMAPAKDMTRSTKVMSESFFLSNMSPQIGPGFNGAIWKSLEDAIRGWVEQRVTITIITGPIFNISKGTNNKKYVKFEVIGENNVAVSTGFFKIVIDKNDPENIEVLAFNFPHKRLTIGEGNKIEDFLCSIDDIEKLTGLDFLSSIPDNIEAEIESTKATTLW